MTPSSSSASPRGASHTPNRLIQEKSPYLQQHAYNPVDWYPWGPEAMAKAKQDDKPIFLSIGYSTCHWCHVMERESFEDPQIATVMNEAFVNITMDREEYPDVDHVYMQAVIAMTGQGGWPLTVILTPDLQPFFGGTYFPKERRSNLPGMKELVPAISQAWRAKRQEMVRTAEGLTQLLREQLAHTTPGPVSVETLQAAFHQATSAFDPANGGFGNAPKFPRSHELSFLLHDWARTQTSQALEMVTGTLDHLARGGIHDHVGGGFHRYSTDERWLVPHFEKMLYDQALLARTFLEAYQITRTEAWASVARDIFAYVLRDLRNPQGGFYAAEDADSEGEEGKFYVWRPQEIRQALGAEEGELIARFYGVTPDGNFEHQTSILSIEQPLEAFAKLKGLEPGALAQRLQAARETLLALRARRVRPHRDEKILTSWNGLMIASLAYGASVLQEPRYLEAATTAAQFVLTHARSGQKLLRRYRDGEARYPGTLEDYAFFCDGLLELYEASLQPQWLAEAKVLTQEMLRQFWDPDAGGLFLRSREEEPLIAASKEIYDGATPSGNSMAALVLLKLGRLTADQTLEGHGRHLLETFAAAVSQAPFSYPQMLIAWDLALGPTREIVIAGDPTAEETRRFLRVLHERFLPRTVWALHPPGPAGGEIETLVPYVKAQGPVNGQPAAYVCENYHCSFPVTRAEEFEAQLAVASQRPSQTEGIGR